MFVALVRPVGWRVFVCTAVTILVLTAVFKGYHRMSDVQIAPASKIALVLFRSHIDQCTTQTEICRILRGKPDLQFLYTVWLFYCLLIAATYRSNLVQQLMKPTSTVSASTFKELLEDGRQIVGLGGKRPGEYPRIKEFIRSEAEKMETKEGRDVLLNILQVYDSDGGRKPDKILSGKINMLEDQVMLEVVFAIMRDRYGVNNFRIAKDVISNEEYWAVKYGPWTKDIVTIIGRLVNGGLTDFFR